MSQIWALWPLKRPFLWAASYVKIETCILPVYPIALLCTLFSHLVQYVDQFSLFPLLVHNENHLHNCLDIISHLSALLERLKMTKLTYS